MSKVFYWSDPHFGHEYVSGLRGFATTDEHDEFIKDAWLSKVGKNDQIWVLGDLTLKSPSVALDILVDLPGTKHLILGNHDAAHPLNRKAHTQQKRHFAAFESVQTAATHRIGGVKFLLSHFPYEGDHAYYEDRYMQWRLPDRGIPLVHGHVHDEWLIRKTSAGTRQLNVGIDRWMDGPASQDEIISMLTSETDHDGEVVATAR